MADDVREVRQTIIRTARYRLRPTAAQAALMSQFAGVTRFVYNLALEQRAQWWRQYKATNGRAISFPSQCRELGALRELADWIAAAPRCALEQALRDLDAAYSRFFGGKGGYPTPRRKGVNDSFRIPGGHIMSLPRECANPRFAEIRIPKIGWCKVQLSRPIPASYDLLDVTIALDPIGWHACITMRVPAPPSVGAEAAVGVDRGIANAIAMSNGEFATLPVERLRALQSRAKAHQKRMSRQRRGSNRRAATRRLLAKTRAKIARARKHWNHQQTTRLAQSYGVVVIEALRTADMTRSAKGTVEAPGINVKQKAGLNRSIMEQGWHQFETMLAYKLDAAGGRLVKVSPVNTSRTCFACGSISKDHRKSQAVFQCSDCGHSAHADTNAALNILRAGEQPAPRDAARRPLKREPVTDFKRPRTRAQITKDLT